MPGRRAHILIRSIAGLLVTCGVAVAMVVFTHEHTAGPVEPEKRAREPIVTPPPTAAEPPVTAIQEPSASDAPAGLEKPPASSTLRDVEPEVLEPQPDLVALCDPAVLARLEELRETGRLRRVFSLREHPPTAAEVTAVARVLVETREAYKREYSANIRRNAPNTSEITRQLEIIHTQFWNQRAMLLQPFVNATPEEIIDALTP